MGMGNDKRQPRTRRRGEFETPQPRTAQNAMSVKRRWYARGIPRSDEREPPRVARGRRGMGGGAAPKAHAGGHVSTRPLTAYQLISGRCGQVPAEMATVRSGNIWARRAGARREPTRFFCAPADK